MKPTQPLQKALRRLALTTKSANKGYYKGTGSGSMGRHTKHGGYIIEWEKVRTYVVPPEIKYYCELTPFVTREVRVKPGRFVKDPKGALSGEAYLSRWKKKLQNANTSEYMEPELELKSEAGKE